MELMVEIAKTQAILQNLIVAIKVDADADVLGSLLVIQDELNKIDEAAEKLN